MHQVGGVPVAFAAAALVVLAACGGDGTPASSPSGPSSAATDPLETVLRLDFDTASGPLTEGARVMSATGPGAVVHLAGPSAEPVSLVPGRDGEGQALRFPAPCPATQGTACPKSVVEVAHDEAFNPGDAAFGFGASVLLEPDETSKGSNVVQKGFSRGGASQWKLQVDGLEGFPSCVLVGLDDNDQVYRARADVTVADAAWHDIACRRDGEVLTISVDGVERARAAVPAGLSVAPPGPVRIAGKNLRPDNDQFFGVLDEVFVERAAGS